MVYKFTKSDEGKYLFYSFWERDNYFELSNFIIRVSKKSVAYRWFFFVQGMRSDHIKKYPHLHNWMYGIAEVDDNDFPSDTTCSYPLRLVMLGCSSPKTDLTKQERQKIVEFEQGKDVSEWLHVHNYGQSGIIERTS
jgi:hypothetical protein